MRLKRGGFKWTEILIALKREWDSDNVGDVAAALTFFGVLALFPFLLFVVSLASLALDPAKATELTAELYRVAPAAVADILGEQLHALSAGSRPGLATVSALGAIWAASGGVTALIRAFNTAYDAEETRPFWKVRGIALITTIVAAVVSIVAAAIAIAAPALAQSFDDSIATLVVWLRLPVAALMMMLLIALLYYFLPNVKQPFRFVTPGSAVAVAIWLTASWGFSFFVSHFGSYEVSYGALAGVIVLLLWMWISAQAVLLGAELNALLERMRQERAVGPGTAGRKPEALPARETAPSGRGSGLLAALGVGFLLGRRRRSRIAGY